MSRKKKSFNWYQLSQRFSIRKYHFGAASVLLGVTMLNLGLNQTAQADIITESSLTADTVVREQPSASQQTEEPASSQVVASAADTQQPQDFESKESALASLSEKEPATELSGEPTPSEEVTFLDGSQTSIAVAEEDTKGGSVSDGQDSVATDNTSLDGSQTSLAVAEEDTKGGSVSDGQDSVATDNTSQNVVSANSSQALQEVKATDVSDNTVKEEFVAHYTTLLDDSQDKADFIKTTLVDVNAVPESVADKLITSMGVDINQATSKEVALALYEALKQLQSNPRDFDVTANRVLATVEAGYPTYVFKVAQDALATPKDNGVYDTQIIIKDGALVNPGTPDLKPSYVFKGWFYDGGDKDGQAVDFKQVIKAQLSNQDPIQIKAKIEREVTVRYQIDGKDYDARVYTLAPDQVQHAENIPLNLKTPGRVFKYWSKTNENSPYSFDTENLTTDLDLTAVFDNKWVIHFDTQGGTGVPSQIRNYNDNLSLGGVTSERQGYTFSHWSTDKDGQKVADDMPVTSDLTLYAVWSPKDNIRYTVLHYLQNANDDDYSLVKTEQTRGSAGSEPTYQDQTKIVDQLEATDKKYFAFADFEKVEKSSETISGDGSTVVKVFYKRKEYSYKFLNGRQTVLDGQARYQQDIRSEFEKADQVIGKGQNVWNGTWEKATRVTPIGLTSMPAENLTFTVQPRQRNVFIAKSVIRGEQEKPVKDLRYTSNDGFKFSFDSRSHQIPGFTVVQLDDSRTFVLSKSNNKELAVSPPTDGKPKVVTYTYVRNVYEANFVLNDGSNTEQTVTIPFDRVVTTPDAFAQYEANKTLIKKDDRELLFKGWFDNPYASGDPVTFDENLKMPDTNLVFYGGWVEKPLTVTIYHDRGETQSTTKKVLLRKTLSEAEDGALTKEEAINLLNPPKGYNTISVDQGGDFEGWFSREMDGDEVLLKPFDFNSPIITDLTLIPVWKQKTVTVTYDYNGGEVTPGKVAPNTDVNLLQLVGTDYVIKSGASLEKEGYQFAGWQSGDTIYRSGDSVLLLKDLNLSAIWSPNVTLDAITTPKEYLEGKAIDQGRVVFPNKVNSQITLGQTPDGLSGFAISKEGDLSGTPIISNWQEKEEVRTVDLQVVITADNETKAFTVPITIYRDTDRDGNPDLDTYNKEGVLGDNDDDNDGIPDGEDANPKVKDDLTADVVDNTVVTEKTPVPDNTKVVTPNKPDTKITTKTPVNGLTVDENGNLVGTPNIDNWNDNEEDRDIEIPVTLTKDLPDGSQETKEVTVPVKVNRDTDGDGIIDKNDDDDDNDGIPDGEDANPKVKDDLTADVVDNTVVTEKTPVPDNTKVVTPNKPDTKITTKTPVNGLTVDENGNLVGTPNIDNWNDNEEDRDIEIPVTLTKDLPDGSQETKEVTVPVKVNRDTDGDGIIDKNDDDDDNDGIPDGEDANPKVKDDLTADVVDNTVVTEKTPVPDNTKVVTPNKPDTKITTKTPVNGLTVDENGNLVGTPNIDNWNDNEEDRDIEIPVTLTKDLPDGSQETKEVTVPVKVNRDTDGDGIIDKNDDDDDNDGIPDGEDANPKVKDDLTADVVDNTVVTEKTPVPDNTKVVTPNKPDTKITTKTPVNGLTVDENGNLVGTPNIDNWNDNEEDRDIEIPVTLTKDLPDGSQETKEVTVPVKVNRDTDGDGIIDKNDDDDDNDGIPDGEDANPKVKDDLTADVVDNTVVTEKTPVPDNTKVVTPNKPDTKITTKTPVNGLTVDENGNLVGTPNIDNWNDNEEDRDIEIPVTLTKDLPDGSQETKEVTVPVKVNRDTDGDGIIDKNDDDDDNDGIPDGEDANPKVKDDLTADVVDNTVVTEKTPVPDNTKVVTPNKPDTKITTKTPVNGLTVDENGNLVGTPNIDNWNDNEEDRDIEIPVTLTKDLPDGSQETKEVTVPVKVNRDTDGDGIIDKNDDDDDNDGIPDGEDANPKVKDDLTADVVDNTVVTEKTPVPDNTKVVTPNKPDTKITTKTPVNGLTVDENGNLVGTPNIDNWNDNEEDRDIEIPVTLTKDLPDGSQETKEVTVPVKVNRDTDGDGIIDKNDDDDDNDGIPDGEDANPKVKDDLTADVVDNTVVTEKTPVPDNTKVVTPNKPDTKITTKTPVNGLTVDENGNLVGTPNIDNWNDNEEDRDIEIPVTLTKDLPDGSQETKEVTVPVKVNRDTDGDGIIDKNDDDDDNDGIPDGEDANPKVKDDLTADVVDNTVVTEKTPVPDNTKVVTPNKPDTKITTKTPVNGLTVDENGNLVGTPNIDNWNDNEEDRDIEIPVTLTKDLPDGSQETKEVTVPVKVNRDTDGDGIIDKNDDDDDNDGIPDGEDANPKVKDDLTADVVDNTVVTEKTPVPDNTKVVTPNKPDTKITTKTPVNGLTVDENGNLVGTPNIDNWNDNEEDRDIEIPVTLTKDLPDGSQETKEVTVPVKVNRDTDGDGIIDKNDDDDDNDGIPDGEDANPKVKDDLTADVVDNTVVTEKTPVPDNTKVVTPNKPDTKITTKTPVNGLTVDENGNLVGTPNIDNWNDNEEDRDIEIPVTLTKDLPDGSQETKEVTVPVKVNRDTDGDGIIDKNDDDDDNDGIPDGEDANPKVKDDLTADVVDNTVVTEKTPVPDNTKVVTPNKPDTKITTKTPVNGLTVDENGNLVGTPNIDNWNDNEEDRDIEIPVTLTKDLPDGSQETKEVTVPVKVNRDTDGDGIIDKNDDDDDNDGIPDGEDANPKVKDDLTADVVDNTVVTEKTPVPDNTKVVTPNKPDTKITTKTPVNGLTVDENGNLVGTPNIDNWNDNEEDRDIEIPVTLTKDLPDGSQETKEVTVPVKVNRDTDGDGIIDKNDDDDDNDGIPDGEDANPKVKDDLTADVVDNTVVTEKTPVPDNTKVVTPNKPDTKITTKTPVNGLTVDENGNLVGTPNIDNWNDNEEDRDIEIPVTLTKDLPDGSQETKEVTVPVKVNRDTDGDGIIDKNDDDDDNDGIPDGEDANPKVKDDLTADVVDNTVVTEKTPVPDNTKVVTPNKPDTKITTKTPVNGLTVDENGNLVGTPNIDNWNDNEEDRDIEIPVTLTKDLPDGSQETKEVTVPVKVNRDTDGDGIIDKNDDDDDNDGIPDGEDANPKVKDDLTADVVDNTVVTEKTPVPDNTKVVTPNKPDTKITTKTPVNGLTVDENGNLVGTPNIDNWNDNEEDRDIEIPVTLTKDLPDGSQETKEVTVPVKVNRDTDGDGIIDKNDDDDDNDGIPDGEDANPKVKDDLTADVVDNTVVTEKTPVPDNTKVVTPNKPDTKITTKTPVNGLTVDENGNLVGTPNIDNWNDNEEDRDIEIPVTLTKDLPDGSQETKEVTVPVKVNRDTDGDGIIDKNDDDDDNDGIPDGEDANPKVKDDLTADVVDNTVVTEKTPVPDNTKVVTPNKPDTKITTKTPVNGLTVDENGNLVGTPNIDNWNDNEEDRDIEIPVTLTKDLPDGSQETKEVTVPVKVNRDTDGDGIIDKNDDDDDNDGIPDGEDANPKVKDDLTADVVDNTVVTEKTPVPDNTKVVTPNKPDTKITTKTPVNGLTVDENGNLVGTPNIDNWNDNEEDRDIEIPVTLTKDLPDGSQETKEVTVPVKVNRDTDGDGIIDKNDDDDDNDGIPDGEDANPKVKDDLTADVVDNTVVTEKTPVPDNTKVVTPNKPDTKITTKTPVNGLTVDENGNLVGTPNIDNWNDNEEDRDIEIPVTLTKDLPDGSQETKEVTVPVKVNRDTDGDGIIDKNDDDDDNDGIPDGEDANPKVKDDLTADVVDNTVVTEKTPVPDNTKVVTPNKPDTKITTKTPVNGLTVDENGNLVGTPNIDNWNDNEEDRDIEIPVTLTKDLPDGSQETKEVTVPVKVNRDTDGDGIIDKNDDDDDNDGIPDGEDTLPKIYNPSGSSFEDYNDPIVSQDLTPEEGSAWVDSEDIKSYLETPVGEDQTVEDGSSFVDHNDPIVSQDLTPEEGSAWVDSEDIKSYLETPVGEDQTVEDGSSFVDHNDPIVSQDLTPKEGSTWVDSEDIKSYLETPVGEDQTVEDGSSFEDHNDPIVSQDLTPEEGSTWVDREDIKSYLETPVGEDQTVEDGSSFVDHNDPIVSQDLTPEEGSAWVDREDIKSYLETPVGEDQTVEDGSSFVDHNDPIVSQDLTPKEGSTWVDSEELKVTQSATQEVVNRRHTDASNLYEAKLPDTGEASSIETVGLGLTVLFVAGALSKRKKSED